MTPTRMVVVTASFVSSASMLAFGVWAYLAPRSFADFIDYNPYNQHLIHDAGAFQVGLGVAVLLAVFSADTVVVALSGFTAASALHTLSHYTDRHIGGHGSDVPVLGLLTVIAVVGLGVHLWDRRRQSCWLT
jgi:hypothetical protein